MKYRSNRKDTEGTEKIEEEEIGNQSNAKKWMAKR